jgi:N-hydroxyarylamine O-acetyltransferase
MVLRIGDEFVDVGFGSATPLGPVPLDGSATYGDWTWSTDRVIAPEGDEVLAMRVNGVLLYTFSDEPRHSVDYVTPNHYSATHPLSVFVQAITVQRSTETVQLTLRDLELTERRAAAEPDVTTIDPADLGPLLRDRFGLDLPPEDVDALRHRLGG